MIKTDSIKQTKINRLMQSTPKGLVLLSPWLSSEGYPYALQQRYRTGGWLKSIGKGAMVKTGDSLVLSGAITALQKQVNLNVHIGGRSALELLGLAHYLQVNTQEQRYSWEAKHRCLCGLPIINGIPIRKYLPYLFSKKVKQA
jgi:hypothetical protein